MLREEGENLLALGLRGLPPLRTGAGSVTRLCPGSGSLA